MKNTIKFLAVLLVVFNLTSCKKKDTPTIEEGGDAYYKVYIDGSLFSESPNDKHWGLINGDVSGGNDTDFGFTITNVPAIGQTVDVSYIDWANNVDYVANNGGTVTEPMVVISGNNISMNRASMFSGSITRISKYKITFTGTYKEEITQGASHDFNGEIGVESVIGTE